jgi:hypothetical protein
MSGGNGAWVGVCERERESLGFHRSDDYDDFFGGRGVSMPSGLVGRIRHFGEACCVHLKG